MIPRFINYTTIGPIHYYFVDYMCEEGFKNSKEIDIRIAKEREELEEERNVKSYEQVSSVDIIF